ncbi:uncharacterized protein LOC125653256 isoform X2 [Ostrea edulis]|uniref:uncharacterized protein LOC125653256 isoform X2 n=1 Tax=Ostrea edulis TaxID=37623 RepID=UPI0024AEACE5|nr:uncharacterized protein LOC125653256 isoform X2 [Ostrea edulis]
MPPKVPMLLQALQKCLRAPPNKISDATRVCSAHFLPTEVRRSLNGIRSLKPGSVPSIFAWNSPVKRIRPLRRSLKNMSPVRSAEDNNCSIEEEPELSSCFVDQTGLTPPVTNDHDYSVHTTTKDQLQAAQEEIKDLQEKLVAVERRLFSVERFTTDPQLINFYTGFKNYETLKCLFIALQPTAETMIRWTQMQRHSSNVENMKLNAIRNEALPLIDQFFMFLCRVRQGFPEQDLAVRFNISQSSVSRILITWANYLYTMLGSLPLWPPRCVVDSNMPKCFQETYPHVRVILDCTEIKVQTPSSKVLNSEMYSNYKSHTTFKSLIGITPCGAVAFISSMYTGNISDKAITALSGILDLLEPNDQVMADKGFLIEDLLEKKQASLVIPPFLGEKGKFSALEVALTHEIARLRIHVERAIRRIKEYHIFDGVIPLNLASSINQIWTVCAILTNFRGPLF